MEHDGFSQHLHEIMQWHFSDKTGSKFWLDIKNTLNFDPIKDVRTFEDLSLFPDVSSLIQDVDVRDLLIRGLSHEDIAGIFESGGTTGRPKRIVAYGEWLTSLTNWRVKDLRKMSQSGPSNTLAIIPSGPHLVSAINQRRAKALGGLFFSIDLDPRWVKKMIKEGNTDAVKAYTNHLIDQAEDVFATQSIGYLVATPPLLEAIAKRRSLVQHLNQTLKMIIWGGTHMDPDTLAYLKESIFPMVKITASYGSTMILSETKARDGDDHNGSPIFDSYAPYVLLEVVDQKSLKPVSFQERGRVVMHHLSKYALLPNILERDIAVRLPRVDGLPGVAVSEVKSASVVSGQKVIEGVY